MATVTVLEAAVLSALLNNDFGDGVPGAWIWSDCINAKGVADTSLGGIVASLVKKGLVETDGNTGRDACLRLTDAGQIAAAAPVAAPAAFPAPVEVAANFIVALTSIRGLNFTAPVAAASAAAAIKLARAAVKDAGISRKVGTINFRATKA